MNSITISNLPFPISKERQTNPEFLRNILIALYPECAESQAVIIAEKVFGQKFTSMPYNHKGWDIISEDGLIKIEVKQTSVLGTSSSLSINSTWPKKGLCTHMMIFDLYNKNISVSIIPHDEFFSSNFHGANKLWRFNKNLTKRNYSKKVGWNDNYNTILFNKYKVDAA